MAAKKKASFEGQLKQLEALIEAMEAGTGTLEETLGAYESGMKLIGQLEAELAQAAQQLTVLRQGPDGVKEEPLTDTEDTGDDE